MLVVLNSNISPSILNLILHTYLTLQSKEETVNFLSQCLEGREKSTDCQYSA